MVRPSLPTMERILASAFLALPSGQWLAQRILPTERQLRQAWWLTELHRVPGHNEIEGNEVGDQWAKAGAAGALGADRIPREEASITTLAYVARRVTETKWQENPAWVKERCRGERYYLLRERQRTDPLASGARKTTASRFYHLRMGRAYTGPYLAKSGDAADDKCWLCGSGAAGIGPRSMSGNHCPRFVQHMLQQDRNVTQREFFRCFLVSRYRTDHRCANWPNQETGVFAPARSALGTPATAAQS
jgi:hypothetical protein